MKTTERVITLDYEALENALFIAFADGVKFAREMQGQVMSRDEEGNAMDARYLKTMAYLFDTDTYARVRPFSNAKDPGQLRIPGLLKGK